jgi:predicted transcriptional regulator
MSNYVTISIPEPLYRRARELARLNHQPVDTVIAEALAEAFPAFDINPQREQMQQEQAAYARLHDSLLATHEGQYVAIHDGELVDFDADEMALLRRIDARYPDEVVHLRRVTGEPEREIRIYSPRLIRQTR